MRTRLLGVCLLSSLALLPAVLAKPKEEQLFPGRLNVNPPPIAGDKSVKYDYDIVYVRAPRGGDRGRSLWTEIAHPALMDAGADLMLLHPDGKEEVLVEGGKDGADTDPFGFFVGGGGYFSHHQGLKGTTQAREPPFGGADVYQMHVQ